MFSNGFQMSMLDVLWIFFGKVAWALSMIIPLRCRADPPPRLHGWAVKRPWSDLSALLATFSCSLRFQTAPGFPWAFETLVLLLSST